MDVLIDNDIRQLVADFHQWRVSHPVSIDGLDQMLSFLDQTLTRGEPMASAIGERVKAAANSLVAEAANLPPEIQIAATYFRDMVYEQPDQIDFDAATHYCGSFIFYYDFEDTSAAAGFRARWNGTFGTALSARNLALFVALSPDPLSPTREHALHTPLMTSFAQSAYNIPFYIDSMQLGMLAWGEGADIANKIWNHITGPASVGQLCSLAATKTVDPMNSPWTSQPFHQAWLRDGLDGVKVLPPEITHIMYDPKGRH